MRNKPFVIAGAVLAAVAAVALFVLPSSAQSASMVAAFALATGLALVGAFYALKT